MGTNTSIKLHFNLIFDLLTFAHVRLRGWSITMCVTYLHQQRTRTFNLSADPGTDHVEST